MRKLLVGLLILIASPLSASVPYGYVPFRSAFYQPVNTRMNVAPVSGSVWDTSDRAGRLLGVVYGSQGQQLLQRAGSFDLQVQLRTAGSEYDARQIRALTSGDVVTVNNSFLLDTTLTGRFPAGSTPADNEANGITASRLGVFNFLFDGSTWDRWPGDSANGGKVQVAAALPAGNNNIGDVDVVTLPANASFNFNQLLGAAPSATNPMPARLTDGTSYYTGTQTGQLPSALVGGRLDALASFVWPNGPPGWIPISDGDSLRLKAWNDAGCQNVTPGGDLPPQVGDCEEYQGMVSIKFMRADANGRADGVVRKVSKIMTLDKAIAAQGAASGGGASWPFGAAAGRGRTVTTATSGATCAITSIGTDELVTSCSHGYTVGSRITLNLTGTNSTPSADGLHSVQILSATTYRLIDINITGAGTAAGTHFGTRTLNFQSGANITANDVGKTLTCSLGGVVCTTSDVPCQGPKFPIGTMYQGMITANLSATSVSVLPTLHSDPGGSATCKIEPVLLDDSDGLELGRGWWIGGDLNYWNSETITLAGNKAGIKEGQTFYEAEINRNPLSVGATHAMHDGYPLGRGYQETSWHIDLSGRAINTHKGDTLGWERQLVYGTTAGYQCSPVSPCPAAGADWTIAVPTNAQWQLTSCRATLTASNTQQTRLPALIVDDGGSNIELASVPQAVQMASTTITYTWCRGCQARLIELPIGNLQSINDLPASLEMTEGARIRTVTTGIHSGDQWSAIVCKIRQKIAE